MKVYEGIDGDINIVFSNPMTIMGIQITPSGQIFIITPNGIKYITTIPWRILHENQ